MTSSNITRTRQYLEAVAASESFDEIFEFYASDVVIQEFPNRIAPQVRTRRLDRRNPYYGVDCVGSALVMEGVNSKRTSHSEGTAWPSTLAGAKSQR